VTRPLAVLIGPPLAGKTTIAQLLARRTGTQVFDTDAEITRRAGKPIPEIFAEDGEPAFRAQEAQVIAEALCEHGGILALGGGAVVAEQTRELLAEYGRGGGTIVLLDISAAEANRRMSANAVDGRPLLRGAQTEALRKWRTLKEQRQNWYTELATIRVNTGRRWPGQIVHLIEKHLTTASPGTDSVTATNESSRMSA